MNTTNPFRRVGLVIALVCLVGSIPQSAPAQQALGHSDHTALVEPQRNACGDIPAINFDYTFENGYCWDFEGNAPPYIGCFAEGFDLGAGVIDCSAYWLTQIGYFSGQTADCYVWEGGVSGPPGAVIGLVPDLIFDNIPFWPDCGRNNVPMELEVSGEFTTGWWGDWHGMMCGWYCAADEDGPGGHPWTYIAPGVGYPSGWQNTSVVFPDCVAMGIGVFFTPRESSGIDEMPVDDQPVVSPTWGHLKSLFGK